MIAKLLPATLGLAVLLLMASSFPIPVSQASHAEQTCYRPLAGSGWICVWEPDPGQRCWRSNVGSSCAASTSATLEARHRLHQPKAQGAEGTEG